MTDQKTLNMDRLVKRVACLKHRKKMKTDAIYDFVVDVLSCLNTGSSEREITHAVIETCEIWEEKEKEQKARDKELLKMRGSK